MKFMDSILNDRLVEVIVWVRGTHGSKYSRSQSTLQVYYGTLAEIVTMTALKAILRGALPVLLELWPCQE